MKKIQLTRNRYALVDDDDYEWLIRRKWNAGQVQKNHWYAKRKENGTTVYMHIEIMKHHFGDPPPGYLVDHCDGDGLDDRKENLRYATRSQNTLNNYHRREHELRLAQPVS